MCNLFRYLQVRPGSIISERINYKLNVTASLLAAESSEVPGRLLHTSFGSRRPSTTMLGQSNTVLCRRVTDWTQSGIGPFQLAVLLRGTLYRIVSMIQHWVLTVLGNYVERNHLRVIKHTKCGEDALWFCTIYINSRLTLTLTLSARGDTLFCTVYNFKYHYVPKYIQELLIHCLLH